MEAEAQALEHMQAELKSQNANLKVKKQEVTAVAERTTCCAGEARALALRAHIQDLVAVRDHGQDQGSGERARGEGPAGDRLRRRG